MVTKAEFGIETVMLNLKLPVANFRGLSSSLKSSLNNPFKNNPPIIVESLYCV